MQHTSINSLLFRINLIFSSDEVQYFFLRQEKHNRSSVSNANKIFDTL